MWRITTDLTKYPIAGTRPSRFSSTLRANSYPCKMGSTRQRSRSALHIAAHQRGRIPIARADAFEGNKAADRPDLLPGHLCEAVTKIRAGGPALGRASGQPLAAVVTLDPERDGQWPPRIATSGPDDAGLINLEIRAAGRQLGQCDPRRHPDCRHAQATVRTVAEKSGCRGAAATRPTGRRLDRTCVHHD